MHNDGIKPRNMFILYARIPYHQMNVKDLHKKAMDFNDKAIIAISKGRTAKSYYKKAFEWEKKAYILFASESDVEPTRSVLLRSAASLAFMAELYEEAEKMIAIGLEGDPPLEILEELHVLNYQNSRKLHSKQIQNISPSKKIVSNEELLNQIQ